MKLHRWCQVRLSSIFILFVVAAFGALWLGYRQRIQHLPIALDGYCVVTLLKQDQWKKGLPEHFVAHEGQRYLFVGENEANDFRMDPAAYTPGAQGLDIVTLRDKREVVFGTRHHGVIYRKKIYLFETEESLQKFWDNPATYAESAENWRHLAKNCTKRSTPDSELTPPKPKPAESPAVSMTFEELFWRIGHAIGINARNSEPRPPKGASASRYSPVSHAQ